MADRSRAQQQAALVARMGEITRRRERARVVAIIEARRDMATELGLTDLAGVLGELIEAIEPAVPIVSQQPDMSKLLVPGMESLPFPGYDAAFGDGDGLPPVVERSDDEDIARMVR